MGQIYVHTLQPTVGQDMQQHANPSPIYEIPILQSMYLRGKKKKYKSKQNANFGKGDALNPSQDSGQQQSIELIQPFLQHHHQMVATTLVLPLGGN